MINCSFNSHTENFQPTVADLFYCRSQEWFCR